MALDITQRRLNSINFLSLSDNLRRFYCISFLTFTFVMFPVPFSFIAKYYLVTEEFYVGNIFQKEFHPIVSAL